MKRKLLLVILFTLSAILPKAQTLDLAPWSWPEYNMEFKGPEELQVLQDDKNKLHAESDYIILDMHSLTMKSITQDEMKNTLANAATKAGLNFNTQDSKGNNQPVFLNDLTDCTGCMLEAKKGDDAAIALLLTDSKKPQTGFFITIFYAEGNYDEATAIMKSFQYIR